MATKQLKTPKAFDAELFAKTTDVHARMALFLTGETKSCNGHWAGKLTAEQQTILFGQKLFPTNAKIQIDGYWSVATQTKSLCWGTDFEVVKKVNFSEFK